MVVCEQADATNLEPNRACAAEAHDTLLLEEEEVVDQIRNEKIEQLQTEKLDEIDSIHENLLQLGDSGNIEVETTINPMGTSAHTFTSLFTLSTKMDNTDELQQREMGDDSGWDESEKELLRWRAMWYTPKALGLLELHHPVRRRAIFLVENIWFERFIQLTITLNCVQMAAEDPRIKDPNSEQTALFKIFGYCFWSIFAWEALTKILALGFVRGKGTYLSDSWNRLDFFIVLTGVFDFVDLSGSSVTVARTFRLLRPLRALRAIGRFKDLRMLVELLLSCIPMLVNVFALIAFILFVFGILGCQLFSEEMRGRCYNVDDGTLNLETKNEVCTIRYNLHESKRDWMGSHGLRSGKKTIDGGMNPCPAHERCLLLYENPYFGYTSFDNIGSAMLIIFQTMLQEDWTPLMYYTWDSVSWWTWTYYIFLNLIGPMFAIQLFLVVVASKYSDAKAEQAMRESAAVCLYEVKVGFVSATINSSNVSTLDSYCKVTVDDKHKKTRVINNTVAPVWQEYFVFPVSSNTSTANISMYNWQRYGKHRLLGTLTIPVGVLDEDEEGSDKWYELIDENGHSVEGGIRIRTQWRRKDSEEWVALPEVEDDDMYDEDDYEDEERSCLGWFQFYCEVLAYSDVLMYTTITVILFNVLAMAFDRDCDFGEHPEYCRQFKREGERVNLFFTAFFTCEMMVKMVGFTPLVYIKETANVFDLMIVATSLFELPLGLSLIDCYNTEPDPSVCEMRNSGGAFSVLRSFRLVRVLRIGKLVSMFPQIQRQLKVIQKTLSTVSSLIGLIMLFLLIFSILGMSLFGGLSVSELDAEDVDGVPFFRRGAYVRILEPNMPEVRTGQITMINTTSNLVRIVTWDSDVSETEMDIDLIADVDPSEYAKLSNQINATMIVGVSPRCHFDDFWSAFLTVFQLLTTSDIGDAMYPALRGLGPFSVLYFIMITVIGNFMLFNLFVAIIITGFSENKADILKEEKENQAMMDQDMLRKGPSLGRGQSMRRGQSIARSGSMRRGASLARGPSLKSAGASSEGGLRSQQSIGSTTVDSTSTFERFLGWFRRTVLGIGDPQEVTADDIKSLATAEDKDKKKLASDAGSVLDEVNWDELPFMRKVVENKYWNYFIIFFIALSCLTLMLQWPGMTDAEEELCRMLNLVCNFVFIAEMLWKVTAYTWKKYIKSGWNRLDFFLVVISILDMISDVIRAASGGSISKENPAFGILTFLKNFRAFRALRPLRILSRAKGLKIVLGTLARAVGPVLNTVVIAMICFFVFGIMSIQVLGGRMNYCSNIHISSKQECAGIDPETGETLHWLDRQLQYGWIGHAMLSMFVLASQDNWEMHMYAAIDATSKGSGPVANSTPETGIFFLAIMIVASFFVMQLFVGVFIDTFQTVTQESKALSRKSSLASENSSVTSTGNIDEPLSWRRNIFHNVVTTKQFDLVIAAFIVGNILAMSADTAKGSEVQTNLLLIFEFVFNFVFGSEVIAKQWGMYPVNYFNSRWNKFDFIVVMISYLGIAIDNLGQAITAGLNPSAIRILRLVRIFRILRAFRIFKAAQGLQNLVRTLLRSLTAVGNLAALLLLLFFVVGVLCVEIFGSLCVDNFEEVNPNSPGKLDRCIMMERNTLVDFHATFENLADALLTLFRIGTSDNWSELMTATVRQPGSRPEGDENFAATENLLRLYNSTGDASYLKSARSLFPSCMTADEVNKLSSVLSCRYPDRDTGECQGTCGTVDFLGYGIFTVFLCCSNFILLNLVMAVLMQELQNAINASERKGKSGLNMLMQVSAATSKWLKIAGEDGADKFKDSHSLHSDSGQSDRLGSPVGHTRSTHASSPNGGSSPVTARSRSGSPIRGAN